MSKKWFCKYFGETTIERWLCSLGLFFFSLPLSAISVENPYIASLYENKMVFCREEICPCEFTFRAGFTGDYIFNRHLQVSSGLGKPDIRSTEIYSNLGFVDFNMWDQVDVFALFGTATITSEFTESAFNPVPSSIGGVVVNDTVTLRMATNWAWGIGLRASFWQWCNFCFGVEGAYYYTNPNVQSVSADNLSLNTSYLKGVSFKYHEWLIALGTTYPFCLDETWQLLPYLSAVWNPARVALGDATVTFADGANTSTITLTDMQQQRAWGYAIGMTLLASEAFSMTLEGRFVNERAFAFNTQILF